MKKNISIFIIPAILAISIALFPHVTLAADLPWWDPLVLAKNGLGALMGGVVGDTARNVIYFIGTLLLEAAGALLTFSGMLLNYSITYSVVEMANFVNDNAAITATWTAIRDLANIVFIFLLIYIAVRTILGVEGHLKALLGKIIFVALIINFSLFFTKVAIDASNIVSTQFYNSITAGNDPTHPENAGFSYTIMNALRLQSIYANGGDPNNTNAGSENLIFNDAIGSKSAYGIITVYFGTVIVLIVALVFFYAAAMFIIRFATLVFLMATSPLAFVNIILPQIHAKWWTDLLFKQLIFAPLFLILMWIAMQIINDPHFIHPKGTWASLMNSGAAGGIEILLNYGIIIAFILFALSIAKDVGGKGASFITRNVGGAMVGAAAFAGRRSLGLGAASLAGNKWVQKQTTGVFSPLLKGARGIASSSFDIRNVKQVKGIGVDLGKAGGKGGFIGQVKEAAKKEAKYSAEAYKDSETRLEYSKYQRKSILNHIMGRGYGQNAIGDAVRKEALKGRVKGKKLPQLEKELADIEKKLEEARNSPATEEILANIKKLEEDRKVKKDEIEVKEEMAQSHAGEHKEGEHKEGGHGDSGHSNDHSPSWAPGPAGGSSKGGGH